MICYSCKKDKAPEEFSKNKKSKTGRIGTCKACRADYLRRRYHLNIYKSRAESKERQKKFRIAHPDRARFFTTRWWHNNRDYKRRWELAYKKSSKYKERNRDKINAYAAQRRAAENTALPSWGNLFFIQEIYHLAALRTKHTGIRWHVDHIVPLRNKLVCGLHVENNLQVIPAVKNISKGNRVWPDMP